MNSISPPTPSGLNSEQKARAALRYSIENKVDFVTAFKAIGFELECGAGGICNGQVTATAICSAADARTALHAANEMGISVAEAAHLLGLTPESRHADPQAVNRRLRQLKEEAAARRSASNAVCA